VGIANSSPSYKLSVGNGTADNRAVFNPNSAFAIGVSNATGFAGWIGGSGVADNMVFSSSGGTERMRIDSSGNVGIGTNSPGAKLEVNGNIRLNGGSNTLYTTSADLVFQSGSSGLIRFANNDGANERARIDSSGNLLVGTTSGSNLITATKNQSGTTAIIHATNTNNTVGNFAYQGTLGANCNTNTSAHFAGISGSSGWYLLGNGTTSYTSDSRLKKNVETARNGYLEDLCQLRVVKYNWANHDDSSPKELGLIAQEVEQVFPSLVQDDLRGEYEGVTYKTLKGSVIPMLLLKAIQEQQALITTLTDRITALEAKP
jgi:hypothetical protein